MQYDIKTTDTGEVYLMDLAHDRTDTRKLIRSEMDRQKISRNKLAKLSGVPTTTVYRYIGGEDVYGNNLLKILGALKVRLRT